MLNYSLIKKGFDINSVPVKLDTIKSFLRINSDNPEQDKFLLKLNLIATQHAEDSIQHSIMKNKLLLCFNQGLDNKAKLPLDPILAITSVKVFRQGSLIPIELKPNKDYFFRQNSAMIFFMKRIPYLSRVEIEYETGYSTPENVPSQIKDVILKHIALIYSGKDDVHNLVEINYLYSNFRDIKVAL